MFMYVRTLHVYVCKHMHGYAVVVVSHGFSMARDFNLQHVHCVVTTVYLYMSGVLVGSVLRRTA